MHGLGLSGRPVHPAIRLTATPTGVWGGGKGDIRPRCQFRHRHPLPQHFNFLPRPPRPHGREPARSWADHPGAPVSLGTKLQQFRSRIAPCTARRNVRRAPNGRHLMLDPAIGPAQQCVLTGSPCAATTHLRDLLPRYFELSLSDAAWMQRVVSNRLLRSAAKSR